MHLTRKMMHDLRFAIRQLFKAPGFTIAAVLVLTLGIGANTAIFSLVHTMLFAPPGYARPNEVVQIFSQDTKNPKSFREFSYPTLTDIREQNTVFSGVAGYNVAMVGMGEKNNTRRTFASIVTANYFEVLGVAPVMGRDVHARRRTAGTRRVGRARQLRLLDAAQSRRLRARLGNPDQRPLRTRSSACCRKHSPARWRFFRRKSGCR